MTAVNLGLGEEINKKAYGSRGGVIKTGNKVNVNTKIYVKKVGELSGHLLESSSWDVPTWENF